MTRGEERQWFEEDSFWRDFYPHLFSAQRFAEAEEQADRLIALLKPEGKAVLDLGCGPGRWAIPLAKRGFQVTGVDRTEYLLDKAQANAGREGVEIEWMQEDIRDFLRPETFDVALSMLTSFGYFDAEQEDLLVLRNVLSSLKPGGVCLIDLMGKEILARDFQPTTSVVLENGVRVFERREVIDGWTRVRNEWTLIGGEEITTFNFNLTVYSGRELKDRLSAVGFQAVRVYGSLDGEEYGPNAQRLIVLGRKR
jgi:SAM-dependent methyltransferase